MAETEGVYGGKQTPNADLAQVWSLRWGNWVVNATTTKATIDLSLIKGARLTRYLNRELKGMTFEEALTPLIIVGAIAVAAIILLVPQIRQQVASFLRIIVGKGYKASTTPIDREMDEYNKAKAKLVEATNNVQTVLGQARTQKRALDTAQAAVTKAEGDVRDAQSMNITGDDLNKYIDALTEAKSTLAAQATRTQTAAKAAEQAQARLEAATKEVQKFAKQIEADKGDMALANALNATTDITRMTADITSGLSKASEAHNEVQSALDRAQAGVDMVTPKADPLEEARKARERQATLDALNGKK